MASDDEDDDAWYYPWWITPVAVIAAMVMMVWMVRKLLRDAEAKRLRVQKNLKKLRKRVVAGDAFYKKHLYSWDWVLVFKVAEADDVPTAFQKRHSVRNVVSRLCEAGLQTSMFYSVQQDEVYCKVRAEPLRLMKEADRVDFKMPLDPLVLKAICDRGRKDTEGWGPITYAASADKNAPFEGHYAAYDEQKAGPDGVPFQKFEGGGAFRNVDRLKLIASIIEAPIRQQGCGLKLKDLTAKGACLGAFPLHDHLSLTLLQHDWLRLLQLPHKQPVDKIRDYFGEKIGLYFVWLGHYTVWLLSASGVGFLVWVTVSATDNDPDSPTLPYFTVFMAAWATLYLESWKRHEKRTACRWGMVGFEAEEQSRPEFDAVSFERESPVTGKMEKHFPAEKRVPVLLASAAVSTTFVVSVAAAIVAVFLFRAIVSAPAAEGGQLYVQLNDNEHYNDNDGDNDVAPGSRFGLGGPIASAVNAVQILVMNAVYQKVAIFLTDRENHRTETEYENALISKTFSFNFVNSFMALFYVAFLKEAMAANDVGNETYCYPNCFAELNTSLGIIFLSNIVAGNLGEVGPKLVGNWRKLRAEGSGGKLAGAGVALTDVEKQFCKAEYDVMMGTFEDYSEMVVQFGYCTLFVAAFPLAPLLAFVNNCIEIKVDGWKLCEVHRRPVAVGAEDIGTWYSFLDLMSTLAVVSNMALFAFTGSQLGAVGWSWKDRVVFFLAMEHVLLAAKFLLAAAIPDVPPDVEEQLGREAYLLSKVVDNIADEDDDTEYETNQMIDLSVKLTDLVPALDMQSIRSSMAQA